MRRLRVPTTLFLLGFGLWLAWLLDGPAASSPPPVTASAGRRASPPRWELLVGGGQAEIERTAEEVDGGPAMSVADAGPITNTFELFEKLGREMTVSTWLELNADLAERTVERFCEEARLGSTQPVMPRPGSSADASQFLRRLVDWEGGGEVPPLVGSLHLDAPIRAKWKGLEPGAWPTVMAADARGLDFGWMREALSYDHWALGQDPRMTAQTGWKDAVLADYELLSDWSALRLAAGLERGDAEQAALEVRHLAMLVSSTGFVLYELFAYRLIAKVENTRKIAIARGLDVSRWPATVTDELRAAARGATYRSIFFFLPAVKASVMRRASECALNPCTAIAEGLAAHQTVGSLASVDTRAVVEALAAERGCDTQVVRLARAATPSEHTIADMKHGLVDYVDGGH